MQWGRVWIAAATVLVAGLVAVGGSVRTAASAPACNLVPQLRDATINQGVGSYSPLQYGKETLVRLYLSMPSCAASGASIQVTGATLTVSGASQSTPVPMTPTPQVSAYPTISTFSVAPLPDSTGDPTFIVPGSGLSPAGGGGFTARFSATVNSQSKASKSATPAAGPPQTFSFLPTSLTNPAPSTTPIQAVFDKKTNPFHVLVVPMGDATKTYSSQFSAAAQAALQDGMTGTVARVFPVASGVGNLGSTAGEGLQYTILPTLLDLKSLNLLDSTGKFCGTGASYSAIKGQLFQMLRAWQLGNAGLQVDSVLGEIDPLIAKGPPDPCFEGMGVLGSAETWAQAITGRAGQLAGLELAHTLGLVPKDRESPFDAGHSQNITAENPPLNRRFNIVQRAYVPTDRSLMKPSASAPAPDNVNTLFEAPDFAYARAVFGGTGNAEFAQFPKTLGGITAATLAFVMSGTTDGTVAGTNVVESYFSSQTQLTQPDATSGYFLRQMPSNTVTGVPVGLVDSEHGGNSTSHSAPAGLFSTAQATNPNTTRIEFWKGQPGASGSLLLYARDQNTPPVINGMSAGSPIEFRSTTAPATSVAAPPSGAKPTRNHGIRSAPLWTAMVLAMHARDAVRPPAATATALSSPFPTWAGLDPIFTVNSTGDGPDSNLGDNVCDDGLGNCTLRAAIQQANAIPGGDTINFVIGSGGSQSITPASPLPAITDPVQIDGTTQLGYEGTPLIELSGSAAGADATGLNLQTSDSAIKGLVVNGFSFAGIVLQGSNDVVSGNYIGTNAAGTAAAANNIGILATTGGPNTIGGTSEASRNVISGNLDGIYEAATGDLIQGNYIGTDAAGTAAVGNTGDGIFFDHGANATVGGTTAAARNVISGNTRGVRIQGDGNVVAGNYIGVAADGIAGLGNTQVGVQIGIRSSGGTIFGFNNTVGGTDAGSGNVIQHNGGAGVNVSDSTGNKIEGNSIDANGALGIGLDGDSGVLPNDTGDPDTGANNRQNFPVIASVVDGTITGTLNSEASKTYRLEFFSNNACDASGNGEGARFLGSTDATTDASGDASFSASPPLVATGEYVTATATDPSGNTSEFSACEQATGGGGGDPPQPGPTFTVNTADDHSDAGGCTMNDCSLREAIAAANAHPNGAGADQIDFAISGAGPQQIAVLLSRGGQLPAITGAVVIDGDTQRSMDPEIPAGSKAVVLNGDGAGPVDGLVLAAGSGGSRIKGLAIIDFQCSTAPPAACSTGYGIDVQSDGNTIDGNYVGLTADGLTAGSNRGGGILVEGNGNTIGGTTAAGRNVIAGNAVGGSTRSQVLLTGNNNTVEKNYIGVAANGTTELNAVTAITLQGSATGNTIGGDKTVGNVILGTQGIEVQSAGNTIAGNDIGLDASGAVHNEASNPGIHVFKKSGTVIGDNVSPPVFANPDKGNVIVGRTGDAAIFLEGATGTKVTGNFLGTNRSGATGMGNAQGIGVSGGGGNTLGPGNTVARNTHDGINVGSANNRIVANSIHDNGGPGIRVDHANVLTAAPILTSATRSGTTTTVTGTLTGTPNTSFFIEPFKNGACDPSGSGEGETYLNNFATATTDGSGNATFTYTDGSLVLGDKITATATNASSSETGEFSNCRTVTAASTAPPGQEPVTVTATDDHPADMRVDLFLDCGPGKPRLPIAVGLKPETAAGTSASFSFNYDPSLACPNGTLKAVGNDGFTSTGFTTAGSALVDPGPDLVRASISSPLNQKVFLTYSLIPLRGSVRDPGGELLDSQLQWTVTGPGVTTGTGHQVDLNPPAGGGWPSGSYTATLVGTNSAGKSGTATATFTVKTDADNDGMPADVESQSCFTTGDNDPLNAFSDYDGDGIPNSVDPQACTPATSYTATADFNPDPLPVASTGNTVTVAVRIPGRNVAQVIGSSVRITQIADDDVSTDPRFQNIAWTVANGVGTAKFDRQKLFQYLAARNIHNRTISITVAGRSGAPPWTFQGTDTTFVQG